MLYYLENTNLTKCRTYGHVQFKLKTSREKTLVEYRKIRNFLIKHRLQRLFKSLNTTKHLTCNHSHDMVDGFMVHHSDGEACKHFNRLHS
jgi:hypothetical protein